MEGGYPMPICGCRGCDDLDRDDVDEGGGYPYRLNLEGEAGSIEGEPRMGVLG